MKFTGILTEANDSGGRFVACPFDARTLFGAARPPVVGTVNGTRFTHRREYAEWVGAGKQDETRQRRALKAVDMLLEGNKHP